VVALEKRPLTDVVVIVVTVAVVVKFSDIAVL